MIDPRQFVTIAADGSVSRSRRLSGARSKMANRLENDPALAPARLFFDDGTTLLLVGRIGVEGCTFEVTADEVDSLRRVHAPSERAR